MPALHTTGTFPELAVYNHNLRMESVVAALSSNGIRRVIDLGCGDGAFTKKILNSDVNLDLYVGIDSWLDRLDAAQTDSELVDDRLTFIEGSMTELETAIRNPEPFRPLGAVVLLETIEHVPRDEVGAIEKGVFKHISPKLVVITTPDATARLNKEQLRARGHYFEWDVSEFHEWAKSIVDEYPEYSVNIEQLTGPTFVRNTQVAVFKRST